MRVDLVRSLVVMAGRREDANQVFVSRRCTPGLRELMNTYAHTESGEPRHQNACESLGNDGTTWLV